MDGKKIIGLALALSLSISTIAFAAGPRKHDYRPVNNPHNVHQKVVVNKNHIDNNRYKQVHRPGPNPIHRPGPNPIHRPGPNPIHRPGPNPIYRPGPNPIHRPGIHDRYDRRPLPYRSRVPGDVNGDGRVTITDASIMRSGNINSKYRHNADLNHDGRIDGRDQAILNQMLTR